MRRLLISIALLSVFAHQTSAAQKSDRDRDGLTGPVRTVEAVEGFLHPTDFHGLTTVTSYDDSGRITEAIKKAGTRILTRHFYSYDADGNRVEEVRKGDAHSSQAPKPRRAKIFVKFDLSGNLVEQETRWEGDKEFSRTRYVYDASGRLKEEVRRVPDQEELTTVYTYRDEALPVESITYMPNKETSRKEVYAYEFDSKGNWLKRTAAVVYYRGGKPHQEGTTAIYRRITYAKADGGVETTVAKDMPDPDSNMARPKIIRKSGGVLQGSATKRVAPQYPLSARENRVSGSVVIEIIVDEDGNVINTRPVSGSQELIGAAEKAVKQWKFKPTTLSGVPVKVIGTITFNFSL